MEISLLQAFALGIIAFIAGLDMFNGLTHMHRPVVLGPLVGLVLGDLHTGILTGGTLELVWMGLAPLAGAQPPNVIIGTIVGTAFAITTGVKPDVAVGVAVPFAVAVQMGITFLFSVMSGVMSRCDRMAENADTRGIDRVNYLALLALGTFYFLCAFLPIYFGAEHAKTIIDVLPQRLIDGLGVAGGIMPAIGFAVLLKIMMKNVYIPYFILGFVAAAWLKLPVLAIAAAALAMALIDLLRGRNQTLTIVEAGIEPALGARISSAADAARVVQSVQTFADPSALAAALDVEESPLRQLAERAAERFCQNGGTCMVGVAQPDVVEDQADSSEGSAVAVYANGTVRSRSYGFGGASDTARVWTGTWSMSTLWRLLREQHG